MFPIVFNIEIYLYLNFELQNMFDCNYIHEFLKVYYNQYYFHFYILNIFLLKFYKSYNEFWIEKAENVKEI